MAVPLSIYVHMPWCVRKCPYCDFNSHPLPASWDQGRYVEALLRDLELELPMAGSREIESIFIGGGTPSLFAPESVDALLSGIRTRIAVRRDAEITLEANPGAADAAAFGGFLQAGINRLSIGVQSFSDAALKALGRIHSGHEANDACRFAAEQGFENVNLDLMFGLPGQSASEAAADVRQAIDLAPAQISYYQLTLEPNTPFFNSPPLLPDEELVTDMHMSGQRALQEAGYLQYEISAYARAGFQCRHNLNYWRFGDYIGLGAGAHGKLTDSRGEVRRRNRIRGPDRYLSAVPSCRQIAGDRVLTEEDLVFEFMLNALRLKAGFHLGLFEERTLLPAARLMPGVDAALGRGLLERRGDAITATHLGWRFLNDLQAMFLPTRRG